MKANMYANRVEWLLHLGNSHELCVTRPWLPVRLVTSVQASRRRPRLDKGDPPAAGAKGPHLSVAEALDRVEVPKEAAERIATLVGIGATLIVSDKGQSHDMRASGTDFVLPTR